MKKKLIYPFKQVLTMQGLPIKGALADDQLSVLEDMGVLIEGDKILKIDKAVILEKEALANQYDIEKLEQSYVLLPGLIDCHTHICFGGSRAGDYAMRIAGKPYLEIAKAGGGILYSVKKTRESSPTELTASLLERCDRQMADGITTCEVKSGYGLAVVHELKMLESIAEANRLHAIDLVPTCLAAHMKAPEFDDKSVYLKYLLYELLPLVKSMNLANRVDIFVEETAFDFESSKNYLLKAKEMGFDCTIHADQFSTDGSRLACEVKALSADHLEASKEQEIKNLALSDTVAVVLPGASLGLGMPFAPARKLLDAGACVAISTDWNPGSAPMGDLLLQASVLAASQKLSTAETLAGISFRAAKALNLQDRGILATNYLADMIAFQTDDYREILYQQGKLKPSLIWKNGQRWEK